MKQRVLTGIVLFLVLLASFLGRELSVYIFDVLIALMCVMGIIEFSRLLTKMGLYNNVWSALIYPFVAYLIFIIVIIQKVSFAYAVLFEILLLLIIGLVTFLIHLFFKEKSINEIKTRNLRISTVKFSFNKAVHSLFAMLYPTVFLFSLFILNHLHEIFTIQTENAQNIGFVALIFAFIIPVFTDTFSMLFGKLIGGKKIAPVKLGPGKTWAGTIGGFLFSLPLIMCVYLILNAIPNFTLIFYDISLEFWHIIILGFVAGIACQSGDIFESWLKRKAGVKDSGEILPGHGGVLDRIDSHIFCAPIILLFFLILLI